ncbi:MAG: DUF6240 domain-containing protein [Lachnospiraceae bacterium]|nr:DUF6240 domain-containing protein [Lachnospiraceae bacterium]
MKITFAEIENIEQNKTFNEKKRLEDKNSKNVAVSNKIGAFFSEGSATEISSGFMGTAFKSREKSKNLAESLKNVENYDAETAHNYMAVMANTLSGEDFNELVSEGCNPAKMPVGEAITNLDRIKVTLAKSGTNIVGFTDQIDSSKVAQITGSVAQANDLSKNSGESAIEEALGNADLPVTDDNIKEIKMALEQASRLEPMSDSAKLYMTENNLEPTIENVYAAQFSAGGAEVKVPNSQFTKGDNGYVFSGGAPTDLGELSEQINTIIENAGYEVTEVLQEDAGWLIKNNVPLTTQTLQLFEDLKNIELPVDEGTALTEITQAMSEGQRAVEAYLIRGYRETKNERYMEETRLAMTHDANRAMAESDYAVETGELTDKVEHLKEKEQNYYRAAFGRDAASAEDIENCAEIFEETIRKTDAIKKMPADVLALFESAEEYTLNDVYEAGEPIQQRYDNAIQTYEAVGTEVRKDLGDSIKQAFRNVDDLLKEIGMEATADNERAVRILGYNSMEITQESVENVKAVDENVRTLLNKMTPAAVVKLIQQRIDPMEIDVSTLSTVIDGLDSEEELTSAEDYAKFLLRLEHNNQITEEEAQSYIGLYRLFYNLEKDDGAAIGGIIGSGKELTLKNLLTETRALRKKGRVEYKVDDSFGGTAVKESEYLKIDTQIRSAFEANDYIKNTVHEVFEKLDPQKLHEAGVSENTMLNELLETLRGDTQSAEAENLSKQDEYNYAFEEIVRSAKADSEIYRILKNFDTNISAENINAAVNLLTERGAAFARLFNLADNEDKKKLNDRISKLHAAFENSEEAEEGYEEFSDTAIEVLSKQEISADNSIDLRMLQNVHKQISIARRFSENEDYEVPVWIDGKLTSINLKIMHGDGEQRVDVIMENGASESVAASFTLDGDVVSGSVESDIPQDLEKFAAGFEKALRSEGLQIGSLQMIIQGNVKQGCLKKLSNGERKESASPALYRTAKAFISAVNSGALVSQAVV